MDGETLKQALGKINGREKLAVSLLLGGGCVLSPHGCCQHSFLGAQPSRACIRASVWVIEQGGRYLIISMRGWSLWSACECA